MTRHSERRTIDLPVEIGSVDAVQDFFDSWWTALGDDSMQVRFGLETAIVEIATNIVEHSRTRGEEAGRRFTLELDADDAQVTAVFSDNGMPADVDLSAVTMAGLDDESGRGLALAIAALDSLEHRHEGGHNIWTLMCRR